MRHMLTIERVVPGSDPDEGHGRVEGRLGDRVVMCRVFLPHADWSRYRPGDALEVDAYVVRNGDVAIVEADAPPSLTHSGGCNYVVVGTVVSRDGEWVELDSVMPLEVDLELSPHLRRTIPDVTVGDRIRVEGSLEVDLEPDED